MTAELGHLVWWRIVDFKGMSHDELEETLPTGVALPSRPLPFDVFRRVTSHTTSYSVGGEDVELNLTFQAVDAPSDKMMTRHIIGTVEGQSLRVGDATFYRPPRGKNSKARLRVTLRAVPEEWKVVVAEFAASIRAGYEAGVKGRLDTQAIRRLVRGHVTDCGGLYLDGPWYVQELEPVERLHPLFDALNDECFIHSVPYVDTEANRWFLTRGLERAVKAGTEIDETIWTRLEGS